MSTSRWAIKIPGKSLLYQFLSSFAGVDKLYFSVRKERKFVLGKAKNRKWLETEETLGLHRQINRKFRRGSVIAPYINYQWDADTAVMKSYNAWYDYFLLAIDVFCRFVRICPLKRFKEKKRPRLCRRFFSPEGKPLIWGPTKARSSRTKTCNVSWRERK